MAFKIKRLPFPKNLAVTECKIVVEGVGVTEDGEPITSPEIKTFCIFSEKSKRAYNKDGKLVEFSGSVIVEGDIAPNIKTIGGGTVTINGQTINIELARRLRNPDGTVHHTELDLR